MPNNTERYARQLVLPQIGKAGQQKLAAARVLLVGLGGLGCPAAQYLAAAGVGTLGLVDPDKVQLSNLHRQILYGDADIGEAKVRAAAPRLRHINPGIRIETFGEKFRLENAIEIAKDFDMLLDCTDNFAARDAINAYTVEYRKPNVFASLYRFEGTLTVFDVNAGAGCYRCLYGESPEAIQNCAEAGVIGALPGILGAMQALEAIKIMTGSGESLTQHTLVYDGLTQTVRRFRRTRDSACRICGISNS